MWTIRAEKSLQNVLTFIDRPRGSRGPYVRGSPDQTAELAMNKIKTVTTRVSGAGSPLQSTAVPSQDERYRDSGENRTLYVLGFGVLGAILADTLVLIYFASFYTSG